MVAAQRKVSVIVPTCDRPALLRQALKSIRALEGPDLTFEILVGDNGSVPETAAVADEFGAIYLKTATRGASASRNVGLRAATGEYLAFLDDDDVWLAGNIRPHLKLLDANPFARGGDWSNRVYRPASCSERFGLAARRAFSRQGIAEKNAERFLSSNRHHRRPDLCEAKNWKIR